MWANWPKELGNRGPMSNLVAGSGGGFNCVWGCCGTFVGCVEFSVGN
jgi:hypothetical protein